MDSGTEARAGQALETTTLLLSLIDRTGSTQARAALNSEAIAEYAQLLKDAIEDDRLEDALEKFPPCDIFFDGLTYFIGDGHHRIEAATEADLESIPVRIHRGSEQEALLFACRSNLNHGVQRTRADRRRAVEILLKNSEWSGKSSRSIADHVGVSHATVDKIRAEVAESTGQSGQLDEPRAGADGKVRRQPTPKAAPSASKSKPKSEAKATAAKPKSGEETIKPEVRREARAGMGAVIRLVTKTGAGARRLPRIDATIDEALEDIMQALKKDFGR